MADRPAIVSTAFYKNPLAAIRWLEAAFGFETTVLLTDADGNLGHAEMEFRGCPVSIGGEFGGDLLGGAQMKSPENLGGCGTQFMRVELAEGLDEHCERARAAGARITAEPQTQFYGARVYRAMDLEGHIWNFNQTVAQVSNEEMERVSGLKFATSREGVGRG